jgi:uncharacterized SAM-binding protein YcdF (DUF218 family)
LKFENTHFLIPSNNFSTTIIFSIIIINIIIIIISCCYSSLFSQAIRKAWLAFVLDKTNRFPIVLGVIISTGFVLQAIVRPASPNF